MRTPATCEAVDMPRPDTRPRWPRDSTAWARRSSPRCPRSPCRTGSVNLGQGFPDTDGPTEVARGRDRRDPRRPQPVPAGTGHPRPAPGHRRAPAAVLRARRSTPTPRWSSPRARPRRSPRPCSALVDPGDEVVALEPFYDSYAACIAMAGGVRVPVTLRAPDFRLDVDAAARRGHRPHPADPAQHTAQPDRHGAHPRGAAGRADLAIERDLLVVTDEVYEHMAYDVAHVPIARCPAWPSAR